MSEVVPPSAWVRGVVACRPGARPRREGSRLGLDVSLRAGRITAVTGPNGSGKSTLLLLLLGVLHPGPGSVRVGGVAPARFRGTRGIGYVPEDPPAPPGWTAEAFLRLGALEAGAGPGAVDRVVREVRKLVDIDFRGPLKTASRGTRRRLALAHALLGSPPLLLLDEPESALDRTGRARLVELLPMLRDGGTTVVLVTHDHRLVEEVADDLVQLPAFEGIRNPWPADA